MPIEIADVPLLPSSPQQGHTSEQSDEEYGTSCFMPADAEHMKKSSGNFQISHPKARSFRNKKVPCFENLVLLFGADRATGHDAETAKKKQLRLEREKNEAELVFLGDKKVEETKGVSSGPANEMEISIESSEVPSSSRGSKKRKGGPSGGSSLHEEFKMLKSSLDTIASAYGQSSPRVILEDELFMEVKKIEGLNEDAVLIAYDFICGDPVRGRTFVGLPVNWRKRWLEIKLGCDFGKV